MYIDTKKLKENIFAVIMFLCGTGLLFYLNYAKEEFITSHTVQTETFTVERVIDGDTIEVTGDPGSLTVRLIGVDTPESVHPDESKNNEYGKAASEWLGKLLTGKTVELEYGEEKTDTYGRTLAYVYLDGEMVNKMLLRNGLAKTMFIPPNTKYQKEFEQIEQTAKDNNTGFWIDYFKNEQ